MTTGDDDAPRPAADIRKALWPHQQAALDALADGGPATLDVDMLDAGRRRVRLSQEAGRVHRQGKPASEIVVMTYADLPKPR